jgi:hypothetical protein
MLGIPFGGSETIPALSALEGSMICTDNSSHGMMSRCERFYAPRLPISVRQFALDATVRFAAACGDRAQ